MNSMKKNDTKKQKLIIKNKGKSNYVEESENNNDYFSVYSLKNKNVREKHEHMGSRFV